MDPALVRQLLLGVVPPMVFGAVVFGLMWRAKQRDHVGPKFGLVAADRSAEARGWWRDVVYVVCVGAAFVGVYPLVFGGIEAWPGRSADKALFWCAVVAIGAGLLWCVVHNGAARAAIAVAALLACGWLSFQRHWFGPWGAWATLASMAMLLGGGGVLTLGLAWLGERGRIAGVIGSVAAVGLCAQVLVVNLASLKHGQSAGAMASFLTFAAVMVLLRPTRALSGPMLATTGVLLSTQLMQGVHFGDGAWPWAMAGLAMSGPICGLIALRVLRRGGVAGVVVPIIATVLPGLVAVGAGAALMAQAEKAPAAGEEYEYEVSL